jgi:hypothetical protein
MPIDSGSAGAQRRQVEAGGEHALPSGEHHHRPVGLGPVERGAHFAEHPRRHRVDLAVVHRDRRDGTVKAVADDVLHEAHDNRNVVPESSSDSSPVGQLIDRAP